MAIWSKKEPEVSIFAAHRNNEGINVSFDKSLLDQLGFTGSDRRPVDADESKRIRTNRRTIHASSVIGHNLFFYVLNQRGRDSANVQVAEGSSEITRALSNGDDLRKIGEHVKQTHKKRGIRRRINVVIG